MKEVPMFAPKKILVPTDFSEYAVKALRQAVDVAKQHKATIYLLHVIGVFQQCVVDYCIDANVMEELEKQTIARTKTLLQEEIDKIPDSKSVEILLDVQKGNPYEVILKEQKKKGVDLIVIASHGKTGILDYFMGSVADKVTKNATCPVLLIRS
jgi:universal stress protein A